MEINSNKNRSESTCKIRRNNTSITIHTKIDRKEPDFDVDVMIIKHLRTLYSYRATERRCLAEMEELQFFCMISVEH